MAQINTTKLNGLAKIGPDGASAPKLVMYARMVPGDGDGEPPRRQGHCYAQIIRRQR